MKVRYNVTFKRGYKAWKKKNSGKDQLLITAINLFIQDQFHPLLHTHKLKGRYKDFSAIAITYDLRIMFYIEDLDHAVFTALGTHDEVY